MNRFKQFTFLLVVTSLAFLTYSCSDSTTGPDNPSTTEFNSQALPGDSAQSFLEGDQYNSLQVEIDYMPGHEPTQEGLDSLRVFLEKRLNKNNISFRSPSEISAGGQSSYTDSEIRTIEEENRDYYTEAGSSTLQAYFLMVDGDFDDEDPETENGRVLGIAYWNTSVAFFGQTIEDVSSGIGAPPEEKIEGTVFRHEFGHNMGLVGNGTPTQSDHKTNGSAHCTTDGCLMEAAVETGDFFANTFDGDIPDLQQYCSEDVQANGGK